MFENTRHYKQYVYTTENFHVNKNIITEHTSREAEHAIAAAAAYEIYEKNSRAHLDRS